MSDIALKSRLEPVARRQRQLQFGYRMALCWTAAAVLGLGLIAWERKSGLALPFAIQVIALLGVVSAFITIVRSRRAVTDWRRAARQVEECYPDLKGLVLTAVQQQTNNAGELGYLQDRLVRNAVLDSWNRDWARAVPGLRLAASRATHLLALGLFLLVLRGFHSPQRQTGFAVRLPAGVTVTPGDVALERGSSLVVLARFEGSLPSAVELVVGEHAETARRIPLVKSLADPIFGGSVPDVTTPFAYHIEYGKRQTGNFKVTVFEYPRLDRADADLTYPGYTGLVPARIEDTRRLSAVEGSLMDLTLQLNKPVTSARLIARDKDKTVIPLVVADKTPVVTLKQFPFAASMTYALQLVDADGRTNKLPAQFVFEVLKNRRPELRLASPRGDFRPSPLEEILFEGTVWDDFGVPAYGLGYTLVGKETAFAELGRAIPGKEKRPFKHLLRLEDLGVEPDQLISWFVWADDIGPDGQTRRTTGDLFFGEVRPFDEIYRESQAAQGSSESEESGEQSEGGGNQVARLAELQKQIISATWKLQRETGGAASAQYQKDAEVVRDSQKQALEQADKLKERAQDARSQGLVGEVTKQMEQAVARLEEATKAPARLKDAVAPEQSAYQALLKLQAREHEVVRGGSRGRGQGAGQQGNQRQLDELELTQSDNRYERQSEARAPQSPERREQLQVMNRLQELARRQQDLNERLKELQNALQEARTEQEREDARQRLKRLQEEERQMLADVDEVRQRMDRPENQSRMADEQRQLEQTRAEVQRAAEAAGQGAASQALASGTRAQRQLQQMRDDMRKENSSQFSEEMREMRNDARELARQQEEIATKLESEAKNPRKTLSDSEVRNEVASQLTRQRERLTNLVERATEVSQQAETAEPLLSRQLYDTLRKVSQRNATNVKETLEDLIRKGLMSRSLYERMQEPGGQDGAKLLDATGDMVRQGFIPQAQEIGQRARGGLDDLKTGVERAAESVLGDDTEALRVARQELDQVKDELEREMTRAGGAAGQNGQPPSQSERQGAPSTSETPNAGAQTASAQPAGAQPGGAQPGGGQPGGGQSGGRQPGEAQTPGQPSAPSQAAQGRRASRTVDAGSDGGGGGGWDGGDLSGSLRRDTGGVAAEGDILRAGPITGDNFAPWSDRLRDVEEMIDFPDLRNSVATARERARLMRLEFKRDLKKPDWARVRTQIVKPLVEVRDRISEELARRASREALVPIDRDPVPSRYSELVRRYYEDLGKDKQ